MNFNWENVPTRLASGQACGLFSWLIWEGPAHCVQWPGWAGSASGVLLSLPPQFCGYRYAPPHLALLVDTEDWNSSVLLLSHENILTTSERNLVPISTHSLFCPPFSNRCVYLREVACLDLGKLLNLFMLQKRKDDNTYRIVQCVIWEEEKIVKDLRSGVVAHVCIPSTLEAEIGGVG